MNQENRTRYIFGRPGEGVWSTLGLEPYRGLPAQGGGSPEQEEEDAVGGTTQASSPGGAPGSHAFFIGPGGQPNPLPALGGPGSAPFWRATWDDLWQILGEAGMTFKDQERRKKEISDLQAKIQSGDKDPHLLGEIERRISLCEGPPIPVWAGTRLLYAMGTDAGLLFVFSDLDPLRKAIERRVPLICHEAPDGDPAIIPVQVALPFPKDQIKWWAWAAMQARLLFVA